MWDELWDLGAVGVIIIVVILFVLVLLSVWAQVFLWNYVVPDIFGLPEIGFWQMLALSTLVTLVTGNFNSTKKE